MTITLLAAPDVLLTTAIVGALLRQGIGPGWSSGLLAPQTGADVGPIDASALPELAALDTLARMPPEPPSQPAHEAPGRGAA